MVLTRKVIFALAMMTRALEMEVPESSGLWKRVGMQLAKSRGLEVERMRLISYRVVKNATLASAKMHNLRM